MHLFFLNWFQKSKAASAPVLVWQPFKAETTPPKVCVRCGVLSGWHPMGWWFRNIGVRGLPRKGSPKHITERLCSECAGLVKVGEIEIGGET